MLPGCLLAAILKREGLKQVYKMLVSIKRGLSNHWGFAKHKYWVFNHD